VTMHRIDGRSMYANFYLTRRSQRGGEQCGVVLVVMVVGYVIVQEAPEVMKRASEMFVRLDHGGRLMLHNWGLVRRVRLGSLRRWSVRCGSWTGEEVE
jgi:hypothetical protein